MLPQRSCKWPATWKCCWKRCLKAFVARWHLREELWAIRFTKGKDVKETSGKKQACVWLDFQWERCYPEFRVEVRQSCWLWGASQETAGQLGLRTWSGPAHGGPQPGLSGSETPPGWNQLKSSSFPSERKFKRKKILNVVLHIQKPSSSAFKWLIIQLFQIKAKMFLHVKKETKRWHISSDKLLEAAGLTLHYNYILSYTICPITMCTCVTFWPHLALVFSSKGFNKVFQTERFPHQDCDSLEENHRLDLPSLRGNKIVMTEISKYC